MCFRAALSLFGELKNEREDTSVFFRLVQKSDMLSLLSCDFHCVPITNSSTSAVTASADTKCC